MSFYSRPFYKNSILTITRYAS